MKIAAIQHDIVWNDRAANFARLAPMIAGAAGGGAELILLTETFSTGFSVDSDDFGEPVDGPSATFLCEQAAMHGAWVAASCPEIPADAPADDRRPHNTLVLAGPDGTTHRYRKIHPFTYGGEDAHVRPGDEFVTVTIPAALPRTIPGTVPGAIDELRVTLFVCYDLRFADEFWQCAPHTDVFLVPANWPSSRRLHWQALLQARAIENQAYVIGCNRVGDGGGLTYVGDSRIVDPGGELLATASQGESVLIADVTAARVAEVRARFRFMQDRRA